MTLLSRTTELVSVARMARMIKKLAFCQMLPVVSTDSVSPLTLACKGAET
jgi:hypothetical protein